MRSIIGMILTVLCIAGLVVPVALGATTGAPESTEASGTPAPPASTEGSTAPTTAAGLESPDTAALTATATPESGFPVTPEADTEDLVQASITFLLRGEIQFALAAFLMLCLQQIRRFWDVVPDEWRGPVAAASLGSFVAASGIFAQLPFQEAMLGGVRIGLMSMGSFSVLRPLLVRIPKVGAWLGFKPKKKAAA